jgi:hypothetical protein
MKVAVVVTGLLLLLIANLLVMYRNPLTPYMRRGEGFQNVAAAAANATTTGVNSTTTGMNSANSAAPTPAIPFPGVAPASNVAAMEPQMSRNASANAGTSTTTFPAAPVKEAFTSYLLENSAGAKSSYEPIGAYDGVQLPTGNSVSQWRYTAPNEKLMGAEFQPGPDSLFMFKNNQCKPECCGASFSCGGGCVCTTPQQRDYINSRGGNRTAPEDGV